VGGDGDHTRTRARGAGFAGCACAGRGVGSREARTGPVESVDDMVRPGLFESDEEWQEFLSDLYACRRSGLA